jgi:biopolymer transport protein ExbB/TolQ
MDILCFSLEAFVVIYIIVKQITSYCSNKERMDDYKDIFSQTQTAPWDIEREQTTRRVLRIMGGAQNPLFERIKKTINDYIDGNSNSVMDFQIFKDAVNRQCDSIESQIESQNPIPLYLGLAGTMIGIIVGLVSLIVSGALKNLTEGSSSTTDGIVSLLISVAIAMVASFVGILLTTKTAYDYKDKKEEAEEGRNDFMSWLQSKLLPKLPNDISLAMTQLVLDLGDFNNKFENNTNNLSHTFDNINDAYKTQAEIIKAVQSMDVKSMATANVRVLDHLQKCTEKLERFNEYLDRIEGYTSTIQQFNQQFQQEETQLGLLKEIRDFFKAELTDINQRKDAIAGVVSNVDETLKKSFKDLADSNDKQVAEFKDRLSANSLVHQNILEQQEKAFGESCNAIQSNLEEKLNQYPEVISQFQNSFEQQEKAFGESCKAIQSNLEEKLNQYPEIVSQLKEISQIPKELRDLSSNIMNTFEKTSQNIIQALNKQNETTVSSEIGPSQSTPKSALPNWMKWSIFGLAILTLITICSLLSTIHIVRL